MEKNYRKQRFWIEKVVKRKLNKLYVKWKGIITNLISRLIEMTLYKNV